jgi:hypothetical protein
MIGIVTFTRRKLVTSSAWWARAQRLENDRGGERDRLTVNDSSGLDGEPVARSRRTQRHPEILTAVVHPETVDARDSVPSRQPSARGLVLDILEGVLGQIDIERLTHVFAAVSPAPLEVTVPSPP